MTSVQYIKDGLCLCVSLGRVGCWSGWFDGTGVSEQADAAWCVSDLMFMQRSTDFFWFGIEVLDLPLTSCWQPFNRVPQVQGFTNYLYGRVRDAHTLKNTPWSDVATCSGPSSTNKHVTGVGGSSLPCCQTPHHEKTETLWWPDTHIINSHRHTQTYRRWININIFKVSHLQSVLKGSVGACQCFTNPVYLAFNTYKLKSIVCGVFLFLFKLLCYHPSLYLASKVMLNIRQSSSGL